MVLIVTPIGTISRRSARAGELPCMCPHSSFYRTFPGTTTPRHTKHASGLGFRVMGSVKSSGLGWWPPLAEAGNNLTVGGKSLTVSWRNPASLKQHHFMRTQVREFACAGRSTPAASGLFEPHSRFEGKLLEIRVNLSPKRDCGSKKGGKGKQQCGQQKAKTAAHHRPLLLSSHCLDWELYLCVLRY